MRFSSIVLSSVVALSLMVQAETVQAETVALPDFAIGVSESDFDSLSNDYLCSVTYYAGSEIVTYCDGAAKTLFSSFPFNSGTVVVARTESNGAMYSVSNEAVTETGGALTIRRYLPNGFYRAGSKHYFVLNNQKVKLTKQTAYDAIVAISEVSDFIPLMDGQVLRTGVIPMDQTDFDSLIESGNVLRGRFRGEVVMNVDAGGALYYLPMRMDLSPRPISAQMTKAEVMHLVKRFSRDVKPVIIKQIHTYILE